MDNQVSLVKCISYERTEVEAAVRRAVDLAGGIGTMVKPGERILLKPNLLSARVPERHVTTHPEVVRALVRLVREAGATPVIGDSPGGAVRGVERVWNETGMKKLADDEKVELVNFETSGAVERPVGLKYVSSVHLARITQEVDGIINIPKLKTHGFLFYTGGVKNFYGCIPGLRKAEYHKQLPLPQDFSKLIAEIYLQVKDKVRLNLVDGIVGMEGNGPSSGDLRKLDIIAAGRDAAVLDTALTSLLGLKPKKIGALVHLARKGVGTLDPREVRLVGDPADQFELKAFKFPPNWHLTFLPRPLIRFLARFIWMKPFIVPEVCTLCGQCMRSCPVKAISKAGDNRLVVNNEACISCLCCHELCPSNAIELKVSRLARKFIRQ